MPPSATPQPPTATASFTASPTPAFEPGPQDFFVAPDGDDANPGSYAQPWATLNHAADAVRPGQTVYVRAGVYALARPVVFKHSGNAGAWITLRAYPGEQPIVDASAIDNQSTGNFTQDAGSIQIEGKAYIRVAGLAVRNSHQMGILARDSMHVAIVNNQTDTTYGPGIAAWDTNADSQGTEYMTITANTVTNANTWDMLPQGYVREGEPPHEAISIAGAQHFEVSYNMVHHCDKEGIDVKEVSKHGVVHHNYVVDCVRQGIYVDAWFGAIEDIEIYQNVIEHNGGAGFAISVEEGEIVRDVRFHHNLVFDNLGTGILMARFGRDGPRSEIQIHHNTLFHNGCGWPSSGKQFYYLTGGIYFFSANVTQVDVRNNILAENCAFQVGYSEVQWAALDPDLPQAFETAGIALEYNLIYQTARVAYPVYAGGGNGYDEASPLEGRYTLAGEPGFASPEQGQFWLLSGQSANAVDQGDPALPSDPDGSPPDLGALWLEAEHIQWWLQNFPPQVEMP